MLLVFMILSFFCSSWLNQVQTGHPPCLNSQKPDVHNFKIQALPAECPDSQIFSPFPRNNNPLSIDCNHVDFEFPVRSLAMKSLGPRYLISFSWWDPRGWKYEQMSVAKANDSVESIQKLILESVPGAAFLDIGANVGFMTFFAPATGRPVYAFEPISYNVAKLCEGYLMNLLARTLSNSRKLVNIFHMAVGPKNISGIEMSRPPNSIGHFDTASRSAGAVPFSRSDLVVEKINMVRIDEIVPPDVPIGVIKIDVQGHEEGVLMGMSRILARKTGYPTAIFFEDDPKLTTQAGWTPGNCRNILERAGYNCERKGADTLCRKSP